MRFRWLIPFLLSALVLNAQLIPQRRAAVEKAKRGASGGGGGGGSCPADGSPSITQAGDGANIQNINSSLLLTQTGQLWQTNTAVTMCKAAFSLYKVAGDISGKTYVVKVYSMTGCTLNTLLATSDGVTGVNGWFLTDVVFNFSTPVALSANTDYAIVVTTTGAADGANYAAIEINTSGTATGTRDYWDNTGVSLNACLAGGDCRFKWYFQ
jgi:hypothetical protein